MAAPTKTLSNQIAADKDYSFGIPGYTNVDDFTKRALQSILQATKQSNDLPLAGDDFDYFSSFLNFQELLNVEGQRILLMIQNILRYENVRGDRSLTSDVVDLEDKFDYLTDANDQILERISNSLDEASGVRRDDQLIVVSASKPGTSTSWNKQVTVNKPRQYNLFTARNIERPQLKFTDAIKNDNRPFCPALRDKPNALKPLQESMKLPEELADDDFASPPFEYPHPYRYELDCFEPRKWQLERTTPTMPARCGDSPPLVTVDSGTKLTDLIDDLSRVTELAMDLEHHSYRSFLGFTCLMQISTRHQDYVIDAIKLRSELHRLNQIFTNPDILKVLHGADSDVEWLQRDFSLYLVNMFDTGIAARLLNAGRFSLGHLLEKYCGIVANKQYQLADWRIRPLPEELLTYAREDTHYLLYIQDCMRNELIERGNARDNMIISLYRRSAELCLKKYKKPIFTDDAYMELYQRSRKVFNSQQMFALQHLYGWRDHVARSEDESVGYILPSHMLLQIAEILPREQEGVLACCNPIPPLVRQSINEIHSIVTRARDVSIAIERPVKSPRKPITSPEDIHAMINRRHDNTPRCTDGAHAARLLDSVDGSPVTTSKSLNRDSSHTNIQPRVTGACVVTKSTPLLAALCGVQQTSKDRCKKLAASIHASFISPFLMYLPPASHTAHDLPATSSPTTRHAKSPMWKLKKGAKKRKSEEVAVKTQVDAADPEPEKIVQPNVDAETDGVLSLSQMLPHKKKKKKIDWVGAASAAVDEEPSSPGALGEMPPHPSNLTPAVGEVEDGRARVKPSKGSESRKMGTAAMVTAAVGTAAVVTPFDYSQTDMSQFSKGHGVRRRAFDPRDKSKKHKKENKSKTFKKDFRSKTFKSKHSN